MAKLIATTFDKDESANSLPLCGNGCVFMWGAYKHNVVVAMGAYIHGVLINPRRACAARVTVLGLCVCVCVCYSTSHFSRVYSCHKRY